MKLFKFFSILLICMISMTGLQANTLDLKKNSKTEFTKTTQSSNLVFVIVSNQDFDILKNYSSNVESRDHIATIRTNFTNILNKSYFADNTDNKNREVDTGQANIKDNKYCNYIFANKEFIYRLSRDGLHQELKTYLL